MPKIAELREIDGALWARLDIDLASRDQPVHLLTQAEIDAMRRGWRAAIRTPTPEMWTAGVDAMDLASHDDAGMVWTRMIDAMPPYWP